MPLSFRAFSLIVGLLIFGGLVLFLMQGSGSVLAQVDGKAVYTERCAFCHGDLGDGTGPVASYLNPRPRDFTSGLFKFRTTASGELPLREDVIKIVEDGVRGTAMPSWSDTLSNQEIEAVVDYLTVKFVPRWGDDEPEVISISQPPRVTDDLILHGEQLYDEMQCWKCHGNDGRADGPSAPTLEDDFGAPIRAADLTKAWRYKGGNEIEDIYTRFSTGMSGSPMPSFFDVLSEDDRWALAAYIESIQTNEPGEDTVVTAKRISGPVPTTLEDSLWDEATAASFFLTGQVIAGPRWQTPGIDSVTVRALHNDENLAMLVEWGDPFHDTENGNAELNLENDTYVNFDLFSDFVGPLPDALAVQFPQTLGVGPEKPYFFWGQLGKPVNLWRWQADETLQEFNAAGFQDGLKPQETNNVSATATWADGRYRLLFSRPLTTEDANDVQMVPGEFIPIAFQSWEGSNGETGQRLSLSSWYSLLLEKPASSSVFIYTALAIALVAGLEWVLVRRARRR